MRKLFILMVLIIPVAARLWAQQSGEIGLTAGTMYYIGELNPGMPFRMAKPAFGVLYRQNFNDRISVSAHGLYGSVAGNDLKSLANVERGLNFKSTIVEAGAQFEVNFFAFDIGSKQHSVTPYIFGGASFFFFDPKNLDGVRLLPLGTEGPDNAYPTNGMNTLFGLGGKFSINKYLGLGAEWGMRRTFTDYLDDVSTTYYLNPGVPPTLAHLASDPTLKHSAGMQRGDSRNNDWYSYAGISATIKIVMLKREKCLEFQKSFKKGAEKLY